MMILKEMNNMLLNTENYIYKTSYWRIKLVVDLFWAKKSDRDGTLKWLPLTQHLKDTALVIDRLWERWLDEGQKDTISKSFPNGEEDGKKLAKFLAYTHDIGKLSVAFVTKKGFTNSPDLDLAILDRLEQNGCIGIKEIQLANSKASHHSICSQVILEDFGVSREIASIVGAHHGKSVDSWENIRDQLNSYSANYYGKELTDDEKNIYRDSQRELFQRALNKSGFNSVEELPSVTVPVQMILTGLLIMADWIASNERYFPLIDIDDGKVSDEISRSIEGWTKWEKGSKWSVTDEVDLGEIYYKRFGFNSPRETQRIFSEVVQSIEDPGIIIFEAPMGLGKTEAALVAVEQMAYKQNKSGLFFGLPTQATSNGIFPRINGKWLKSISEERNEMVPIRLSHGKSALNSEFQEVSKNIYEDDGRTGTYVNEWFSGRKTSSLDDFVVGTVDHFLMMSLKQKHLFLRHLGFSNKVVVIDEAHAYDTFSSEYLYRAVQWAGAYNVPIIILSATLPSNKRKRLINNYLQGKGCKIKELKKQKVDYDTSSYPLITYTEGKQIRQFDEFPLKHEKTVKIIKEDSEKIFEIVDRLSKNGGVIGIIANTVKKAQNLAKEFIEIYGEENISLLHSSFIATDRNRKEDELMAMIGSGATRPKFKIIIGTQVIEQSLDIDFDVLISDLCPMDLLIQRIGRLFRHDITRPMGYENPVLYVLGTSEDLDFEEGSVAVYDGYTLARTQYFLPDEINIPEDISPLVQKVYGSEEIELDKRLIQIYNEYREKFERFNEDKEDRARVYLLKGPNSKSGFTDEQSIMGMFDTSKVEKSRVTEEQTLAQVRDIKETVEVIAVKKVGSGYGLFSEEIDLSKDISDFEVVRNIAKNTVRLPNALTFTPGQVGKIIDTLEKYNMEYLPEWQETNWLKGSLGIIFDENNDFEINGYKLHYDNKLGLTHERL